MVQGRSARIKLSVPVEHIHDSLITPGPSNLRTRRAQSASRRCLFSWTLITVVGRASGARRLARPLAERIRHRTGPDYRVSHRRAAVGRAVLGGSVAVGARAPRKGGVRDQPFVTQMSHQFTQRADCDTCEVQASWEGGNGEPSLRERIVNLRYYARVRICG